MVTEWKRTVSISNPRGAVGSGKRHKFLLGASLLAANCFVRVIEENWTVAL